MIKEALDAYAVILNHPAPGGNREATVGASEIGLCARRTCYKKHRVPRDPDFVDHPATRGTVMERSFWYPAMRQAYGNDLKIAGPYQVTMAEPPLSATPDGLLVHLERDALKHLGVRDVGAGRCILIENKTIDPRGNLNKAKAVNVAQVQVQLGLVRRQTHYRPNYGVISYINASFWSEVTEFAVRYDPKVFAAAKARASKILTCTPEEVKPEGAIAGGDECDYCPWARRCGGERREVPKQDEPIDPQFRAEMTDMCARLLLLRSELKADEDAKREQEQAIKDRLREKKVRRVPGVVVWSSVKGIHSYDNAAIREAAEKKGVDIEKYSTVGEPTDRLQIQLVTGNQTDDKPSTKHRSTEEPESSQRDHGG